jgi:murein DD-endopeptidase MepM/ murein hydrolase activator NlpD
VVTKLFLVFALACLPACATVEQPLPPTTAPATLTLPLGSIEHTVLKGETLWRISKAYNVDLDDILKTNRITDATAIAIGQKIIIPKIAANEIGNPKRLASKENSDFIWPVQGKIVTQFRQRNSGVSSKGIDILTETPQDIVATRSGKISFVGDLAGYGPTLIIDHEGGFSSVYAGNSSVIVALGDEVKQGMAVARTSGAGDKRDGLLHFEIRKRSKPQNPLYYLSD